MTRLRALLATTLLVALPAAAGPAVYLGALTERGISVPDKEAAKFGFKAQPLFVLENGKWMAMPSEGAGAPEGLLAKYPEAVAWTLCFDGKSKGALEGKTIRRHKSARTVGYQTVTKNATTDWAGKLARPFALSSAGQCADPDRWKPAKGPDPELKPYLAALREDMRRRNAPAKSPLGPYTFGDKDAAVVKRYLSVGGAQIVFLEVARKGEPSMEAFAEAGGAVRALGPAYELVDAGDYAGTGHSQLLFRRELAEEEGFLLLDDKLATAAERHRAIR